MTKSLFILVVILGVDLVQGNPNMVPRSSCVSMQAGHSVNDVPQQPQPCPYEIVPLTVKSIFFYLPKINQINKVKIFKNRLKIQKIWPINWLFKIHINQRNELLDLTNKFYYTNKGLIFYGVYVPRFVLLK